MSGGIFLTVALMALCTNKPVEGNTQSQRLVSLCTNRPAEGNTQGQRLDLWDSESNANHGLRLRFPVGERLSRFEGVSSTLSLPLFTKRIPRSKS